MTVTPEVRAELAWRLAAAPRYRRTEFAARVGMPLDRTTRMAAAGFQDTAGWVVREAARVLRFSLQPSKENNT